MTKQKHDVVVIGAGLGGMSAATYLARKGYDVLLLERHNVPGGFASSFVRGRFELEVSLHVLADMGTPEQPGALRSYLDYLGVGGKLDFVPLPHLYRSVFPDLDLILPAEAAGFGDVLCRQFPRDADGISRFLKRVLAVSRELSILRSLQRARPPDLYRQLLSLPFSLRALPRYLLAAWGDVLERDVGDERARAVLSQIWGYLGLPPSQVSFIYFALALGALLSGASYVRGRSQALSSAFIATLRELGSEARFSCGARRILTRNGRATAVETDDGEIVEARAVISNADPVTTCRELIGPDEVPRSFFDKLRCMEPSASVCCFYAGVAQPPAHFGLSDNDYEIFVNDGYDLEEHYERSFHLEPPGMVLVCSYSSVLPDISPPGTTLLSLTALAHAKPWYELPPERYFDAKNAIADPMIAMAERVLPGLRDQIEVVEVSTPITHMRFAGTLGGAIYGFANPPYNHTMLRPGAQGPLEGLYFVGAWAQPGGGFGPAMVSGNLAGVRVEKQLGAAA